MSRWKKQIGQVAAIVVRAGRGRSQRILRRVTVLADLGFCESAHRSVGNSYQDAL